MFDDEDIRVDQYSYQPSSSSPSVPLPVRPHPAPAPGLPLRRLPPLSSTPSPSFPAEVTDISNDELALPPTPRYQLGPLRLSLQGGGGSGKGRRSSRREPIPHSPHCEQLSGHLNRPFQCIFPDTVDGVGGGGGERCDAEFATRQACENHIRTRHTKERLSCSYDGCTWSTHDVQNLNKHERTTHKQAQ